MNPNRCILILSKATSLPNLEGDYIGVDQGAFLLAKHQKEMVLAIGDFDSTSQKEREELEPSAKKIITLNPIKDDSDSEAALMEALKSSYDEIILWTPFGGRFDHSYVNYQLLLQHDKQVKLMDEYNLVSILKEGTYLIPRNDYPFISFFALEESELSLNNTKYPLDHRKMNPNDLYGLSNEIDCEAEVVIHQGKFLVVQSSDKKEFPKEF